MRSISVTLLALLLAAPVVASSHRTGNGTNYEAEVRATLIRFLVAFDNLDWDAFRNSFDDHATVFYPRGVPRRANGRAEFEKNFQTVFQQIRGTQTAPPYMHIEPIDLSISIYGTTAIVTFHLDDRPGFVNRRTVVLVRGHEGWKIVHLHASEVALAK